MADAELSILIKARNEAKAEFDKLNAQVKTLGGQSGVGGLNSKLKDLSGKFQSVTGVSLGFASAAGLAGAAVSGLWKFLKGSVEETVKYQSEIKDLSRLLGLNTEETSRLVQASDDLFLSQESLSTALLAATRKGVDTSIEGIKRLSEQYLKLNPGVERGKFLMDNFGRSGSEMGKLMEVGADGIAAAMEEINKSLVVTDEAMRNTMNYKRSVDNLQDAWLGFKMIIGQEVIPQLDLLLRMLTPGKDAVEENAEAVQALNDQLLYLKKYGAMAGLSQEELAKQIAAAEAELLRLKDSANTANEGMDPLEETVHNTSDYFASLNLEMVYNRIAAGMDADAAFALAVKLGLVNNQTYFTMTAIDKLTTKYDTNKDGVLSLTEMTSDYYAELRKIYGVQQLLKDKTVTYTIVTKYEGRYPGLTKPGDHPYEEESAVGGHRGRRTLVGELGPEIVDLPPGSWVHSNRNSQSMGGGGGGGVTVNLNYAPALSLSDKTEMETRLVPLIQRALARAM